MMVTPKQVDTPTHQHKNRHTITHTRSTQTHTYEYWQVAYYARQFDRDVARVLARFRQAQEEELAIYEVLTLDWLFFLLV